MNIQEARTLPALSFNMNAVDLGAGEGWGVNLTRELPNQPINKRVSITLILNSREAEDRHCLCRVVRV